MFLNHFVTKVSAGGDLRVETVIIMMIQVRSSMSSTNSNIESNFILLVGKFGLHCNHRGVAWMVGHCQVHAVTVN